MAFPTLRTLELDAEIEAPTRFLEWADGISLVDLTVVCPLLKVHRLFSAIETGISHSSLQQLAFHSSDNSFDGAHVAAHLIRGPSLRHLFCFVNLTSLSVSTPVGFDLDDETVTDMARSWRHIEYLDLQALCGTPAPRATLRCLQAFPQYCPQLTSLSMSFDATVLPESHGAVSLQTLRYLNVEGSPIGDAVSVGQYINAIFPSLRRVETLADTLGGDYELAVVVVPRIFDSQATWQDVERVLCGTGVR
ncbi:hypothetical protein FB45DRAFT_1040674 [Roridomyces roridus]|uniref:Uncharacterized protein n=1 Tax=Roridomyces roridus TaxID=1738132 RepID=A0AAD7F9R9_9AGAR|nr:hypothetical protein FB45DRAFT_1040674 [Roridomyces roridus]